MTLPIRSTKVGTRLLALSAGVISALAVSVSSAETVSTVNGVDIDSEVLNIYMQSRTQRPAEQVTDEERSVLLDELTDLYLLSTQDTAKAIRDDKQIQAQIELQSRSLVAQAVATNYISSMTISDEEVMAEYEQQAMLAPPLQYKARHILVESQGAAASIISELDGGANFEELAKEKSTGPSGPNGGDLGWFSPNQMVKPFSDAVEAMDNGKYSPTPVQTDFGWHVILREDSRETEAPPLESVRETIEQALQQQKFAEYLASIREDAQ